MEHKFPFDRDSQHTWTKAKGRRNWVCSECGTTKRTRSVANGTWYDRVYRDQTFYADADDQARRVCVPACPPCKQSSTRKPT